MKKRNKNFHHINEFLEELKITKVSLSKALGMETPSSFGRYKTFDDLKKLTNQDYKRRAEFLFLVDNIKKDDIAINVILNNKEEFKVRLNYLLYFYEIPKIEIPKKYKEVLK